MDQNIDQNVLLDIFGQYISIFGFEYFKITTILFSIYLLALFTKIKNYSISLWKIFNFGNKNVFQNILF